VDSVSAVRNDNPCALHAKVLHVGVPSRWRANLKSQALIEVLKTTEIRQKTLVIFFARRLAGENLVVYTIENGESLTTRGNP